MSSSTAKTSPAVVWGRAAAGIVIMLAGGWLYDNVKLAVFDDLAKQGIPLNPWKSLAVIGVFLVLFPIIKSFFIDPLAQAIQDRNSELEKTFTEAETLKSEMAQLKSDFEKRIAATEAKAREEIQAQVKEAQDLRKTLTAEAAAKSEEMVRRAQEQIEADKARAMLDIRVKVATLSLGAAEKLLNENMDTDRNRRLVDEFLETAEVLN
jgi:F-type H+-transporting ATPase subunit b